MRPSRCTKHLVHRVNSSSFHRSLHRLCNRLFHQPAQHPSKNSKLRFHDGADDAVRCNKKLAYAIATAANRGCAPWSQITQTPSRWSSNRTSPVVSSIQSTNSYMYGAIPDGLLSLQSSTESNASFLQSRLPTPRLPQDVNKRLRHSRARGTHHLFHWKRSGVITPYANAKAASTQAAAGGVPITPSSLASLMHTERLQSASPDDVKHIWHSYHEQSVAHVALDMSPASYDAMQRTAADGSVFLLPVEKNDGFVTMVCTTYITLHVLPAATCGKCHSEPGGHFYFSVFCIM